MRRLCLTMVTVMLSASAAAAPVVNLKINGGVKPPTCTVNGGQQADLVFDFGSVSPGLIQENASYNDLPQRSNTLTVVCDAATYLTFKATDAYTNSFIQMPGMIDNFNHAIFTLVDMASPEKTVGGVSYKFSNVTADGQTVYLSRANEYSTNWPVTSIIKGITTGWTKTQQSNVDPAALDLIAAKTFSAIILNSNFVNGSYANTYLLPKAKLTEQGVDLTQQLDFTSNTLMTFNFGI